MGERDLGSTYMPKSQLYKPDHRVWTIFITRFHKTYLLFWEKLMLIFISRKAMDQILTHFEDE